MSIKVTDFLCFFVTIEIEDPVSVTMSQVFSGPEYVLVKLSLIVFSMHETNV